MTTIEWTQKTWNPVTGCTKVSAGCKHCYAETMAKRLKAMGQERYKDGFKLTLQEDLAEMPLKWKKPRMIFVNSMSDLFHEDIPDSYIKRIFETMAKAHWHTFQILTKRSSRLAYLADKLIWSPNVWMGVSIEDSKVLNRLYDLKTVPASVRFLSLEPLIGPLSDLDLTDIHWVIVGGESGPGARYMDPAWVDEIHKKCISSQTPFFFKQWGGVNKKKAGRLLQGKLYDEMPNITTLWKGCTDEPTDLIVPQVYQEVEEVYATLLEGER